MKGEKVRSTLIDIVPHGMKREEGREYFHQHCTTWDEKGRRAGVLSSTLYHM